MECFAVGDLEFEPVLCSVLLTVISKTNDFCYFLYKAANLSEKIQRYICTQAVTEMLFILVNHWKQISKQKCMVRHLHFLYITSTALPLGPSLLLGPCFHGGGGDSLQDSLSCLLSRILHTPPWMVSLGKDTFGHHSFLSLQSEAECLLNVSTGLAVFPCTTCRAGYSWQVKMQC